MVPWHPTLTRRFSFSCEHRFPTCYYNPRLVPFTSPLPSPAPNFFDLDSTFLFISKIFLYCRSLSPSSPSGLVPVLIDSLDSESLLVDFPQLLYLPPLPLLSHFILVVGGDFFFFRPPLLYHFMINIVFRLFAHVAFFFSCCALASLPSDPYDSTAVTPPSFGSILIRDTFETPLDPPLVSWDAYLREVEIDRTCLPFFLFLDQSFDLFDVCPSVSAICLLFDYYICVLFLLAYC